MSASQKIVISFFAGCFLFYPDLFSQKEKTNWYFGANAGLNFSTGSPVVVTNGKLTTDEGCATMSDKNTGQLLFYTNGITVRDRNHQLMPNGSGLLASLSTTQATLIVPDPGNDSLYYLFSVDDLAGYNGTFGGVAYSIVDMRLNGGFGDVTTKNQIITSIDTVAEKITAVRHCNTVDYWVIVHRWRTNEFYSYLISATGISAPVISSAGTNTVPQPGSANNEALGYLKASPNGKKLAAVSQVNRLLEIYNFNNSTGVVSNALTFLACINPSEQPYGVSFSPDNTKLYISLVNIFDTSRVMQYDLSLGSQTAIAASKIMVGHSPAFFPLGALQLGPDNKIYIARAGAFLDVINSPNSTGVACNYNSTAINLSPKTNKWGLPNFIDADASTIISVSLGNDTTLCGNQLALNSAVTQGLSYTWSNGSTTQNITATASGQYWLQASNGNCIISDTINIIINNLPIVNAGPDSAICVGAAVAINASSSSSSYSWTPFSGLSCTNCSSPIATPTLTTSYILHSTDPVTGCTNTDTIKITVDITPVANAGLDDSICEGQTLQLMATGGNSYLWDTGDTTANTTAQPITTTVYSVVVSNGACHDTDEVMITVFNIPFADAGAGTQITEGTSATLSASGNGAYSWYPSAGLNCTSCQNPVASPTQTTQYFFVVTDSNGCTQRDSVLITVSEKLCTGVFVPNAFSPNDDGQNDILFVKGNCIKTMHIEIYNRWGQKVAESNDPEQTWDGAFNGEKLNTDVFIYKLTAYLINEEEIMKKGIVHLIR